MINLRNFRESFLQLGWESEITLISEGKRFLMA